MLIVHVCSILFFKTFNFNMRKCYCFFNFFSFIQYRLSSVSFIFFSFNGILCPYLLVLSMTNLNNSIFQNSIEFFMIYVIVYIYLKYSRNNPLPLDQCFSYFCFFSLMLLCFKYLNKTKFFSVFILNVGRITLYYIEYV